MDLVKVINENAQNVVVVEVEKEEEDDNELTTEDYILILEEQLKKERINLGWDKEDEKREEDKNPDMDVMIVETNQPTSQTIHNLSSDNEDEDVKPPENLENVSREQYLKQLLAVVDECLTLTKTQMDGLLQKEFQLCLMKDNLMKNNKNCVNKTCESGGSYQSSSSENRLTRMSQLSMSTDFIQHFKAPYFKDWYLFPAPKNTDSLELMTTYHEKYFKPWSNFDVNNLQACVRKSIVKTYIAVIKRDNEDVNQLDYSSKLDHLKTIDYFKKAPLSSFITEEMEKNIDWITVADSMKMKFTPNECKSMWHLYGKPSVSKKKWSNEEIAHLKKLVRIYDNQNWEVIASKLNTNRTGYQCFLYYMKYLNKQVPGNWTKTEENFLKDVVTACTYGDRIIWNKVCYYFESKTFRQIFHKWAQSNPNVKKGQFKKKEDELLLTLIHKFNMNFDAAAKVFKNRTATQLKERYEFTINPETKYNYGEWTVEEDKQLMKLVEEYGDRKWAAIAMKMKTRSRIQVRHRYKNLIAKLAKNPNLDISKLKRQNTKRLTKSKTVQQSQKFLAKLKTEKKYKKMKLKDISSIAKSVYKERKQSPSAHIDHELVKYFENQINTDSLNLENQNPISDYSLGNLTEEIKNILTVFRADISFDERQLEKIFEDVGLNKLGESGREVVKLFNENYLLQHLFSKDQPQLNPQALGLLPSNFNSIYALWHTLSMLRKQPAYEHKLSFRKNDLPLEDKALLDWNRRIHSLFVWAGFLSINKMVKTEEEGN